MLDEAVLEKRLSSLERAVAEVQEKLRATSTPNWLERVSGSISDQEAFQQALEYGRVLRQADAPTEEMEENQ